MAFFRICSNEQRLDLLVQILNAHGVVTKSRPCQEAHAADQGVGQDSRLLLCQSICYNNENQESLGKC